MKKLKRNLNDLFELGRKFFLEIGSFDRTALIFHRDADGLCSAAIVIHAMEKMGIEIPKTFAATNNSIQPILKKVKGFDKIVVVDIDIVYLKKFLSSLEKEIMIVDHHPPRGDLNTEKIIYINPHFSYPEIYQPASYILYKLFSHFLDMKEIEWVAVVGTSGDYGFENCKDLMQKWVRIKRKEEILETEFGKAALTLNGAGAIIGYENVLEELLKTKNVNEIFENKKIVDGYKQFLKKYEIAKKMFVKNMKEIKELNLMISEIKSLEKQRFGSPLATEFGTVYPKKIIVLISRENGVCSISARGVFGAAGELHLGKLMEKCCKGIGGGGGHRQAAGGTVSSKKVEIFKKRMTSELERLLKPKRV